MIYIVIGKLNLKCPALFAFLFTVTGKEPSRLTLAPIAFSCYHFTGIESERAE